MTLNLLRLGLAVLPTELPLISAHVYHLQVVYVSTLSTAFNLSKFNNL